VTVNAQTSTGGGGSSPSSPSDSDTDVIEVSDDEKTPTVETTTENGVTSSTTEISVSGESTTTLTFDDTADTETTTTATLRSLSIQTSGDEAGSISVVAGDNADEVSTDEAEPLESTTANEAVRYIDVETDLGQIVDSATFEVGVSADAVEDPDDLSINQYTDGEWTELETDHRETADGEHTVAATSDGFSTFAVGVVDSSETEEPVDTDDEIPGFGITTGVIALVTLLGVGYRRHRLGESV